MAASLPKSIFDLPPLETGGVANRVGLAFQDHVAAGFCLIMLLNPQLLEVWCEAQDDITLIWKRNGLLEVEFIQVKSNESDQLWSIAMLCDRDGKKVGHSILEKSLANDRCSEPHCFRIVTLRPVQTSLTILLHELNSLHRLSSDEAAKEVKELKEAIGNKVGEFRSPNGNDSAFWVDKAVWEVRHAQDAVEDRNHRTMAHFLEEEGIFLMEDQKTEVYASLLSKVWDAGRADFAKERDKKRIKRSDLADWFRRLATTLSHPAALGSGEAAERKMKDAELPEDVILAAHELRRSYRQEVLRPRYLALKDRQLLEGEVLAVLQRLKSQLDIGALPDSGIDFHHRCLEQLQSLRTSLKSDESLPLMFFEGCMYNIVDRCLHRFRRASA